MNAKTAEKALKLKHLLTDSGFLMGVTLGIAICLALALAYCQMIIIEQDAFIHELLLRFSNNVIPR